MAPTRRPIIDRALEKLAEDQNGCWIYHGALNEHGYGIVFRARGVSQAYVHRITYEYFVGEIPAGLQLDHLCRVRRCANPYHLEPVTGRVNSGRGARALRTHCKYGHEYTPENTVARPVPYGGFARRCHACVLITMRASKARQRARLAVAS
jgi:hypothetical protein